MRWWSDRGIAGPSTRSRMTTVKERAELRAGLRSYERDARRCASSGGAWVLRYAQDDKTTRYAQDDQHYSFRSR
jgi:hypothetical protein